MLMIESETMSALWRKYSIQKFRQNEFQIQFMFAETMDYATSSNADKFKIRRRLSTRMAHVN